MNSLKRSNSLTRPMDATSAGIIRIFVRTVEPLIETRENTNNTMAPAPFTYQKISGCCENREVRTANTAWVLNVEGTTLKYHQVNTAVAENEISGCLSKELERLYPERDFPAGEDEKCNREQGPE